MRQIRNNWTKEEISTIYFTPLIKLAFHAASIHRQYNHAEKIQISSLISIKTGGCTEDCSYCPQSARYHTDIQVEALMDIKDVLAAAHNAKLRGASRLCMGAAWREVRDNRDFDRILEMVKAVNSLDMEVCCTLGMLSETQAKKLAEAGLYAYNHNLDTSEDNYKRIISTRKYEDRLQTLQNVRKAKISVCSGGIIGLGETDQDRIDMLHTLATLPEHPESVPINALIPIKGTPLEKQGRVPIQDMIRMVATARILMPLSFIRLSAGRTEMSLSDQMICFMAGANSIFSGNKLLTAPNPEFDQDMEMLKIMGLQPLKAKQKGHLEHLSEI